MHLMESGIVVFSSIWTAVKMAPGILRRDFRQKGLDPTSTVPLILVQLAIAAVILERFADWSRLKTSRSVIS